MTTEKVTQSAKSASVEFLDFYELLDAIRQKPAMYIGTRSLSALQMWLDGYLEGRRSAGLEPTKEELEFQGFDAFVQKKYRWQDNGGWWGKILYFHRDEAAALEEFFSLLDEFRTSRHKQRKLGLHTGAANMSDDFDAPLPDEFWTGTE